MCPLFASVPHFFLSSHLSSSFSLPLTPQCDGTDLTPKIQELKFQCIVFLNIPRCVVQRSIAGAVHAALFYSYISSACHVYKLHPCPQVLCRHHALGQYG